MYGPDVFAVLTPWREQFWANTIQAFGHPHNAAWLDREPIGSREPTPALSPTPDSEHESVNRLVLRFEQLSSFNETQFGTDEKVSHILLKFPGVKAVSARQFVIVVRPDYTVYLEDRFSTYETRVMQDGKVEEHAVHGDHILAGQPGLPKRWDEVVILTGNLAYTIEFPNHATGSSKYLKKLGTFRERDNTEVPLFGALGLHSNPITAAPSRPFTPHGNERPAYLDIRKLASSAFGTVRLMMNTRDRNYYVKKTILTYPKPPQAERKRKREMKTKETEEEENKAHEAWFKNFRSQMELLQTIDHPNILRVIDYGETPDPFYIMRYYERGTLKDLHRDGLDEEKFPEIFLQLLLGLHELHKLGFAHRDLKEENILVGDDLTLILGDPDFMKSEKDNVLKTFCGTALYAAPEIWPGRSKSYGLSVDIWSLAICILKLFYDLEWPSDPLPAPFENDKLRAWNQKLCKAVFKQLDELDENNDQIIDILKPMLKFDPAQRCTVDQCLKRGCENGLFRENRFGNIVLAEATEVNTEVNSPAGFSVPNFGLDDGAKTPTTQSSLFDGPANVSLLSTICPGEIAGDAEDGAIPQLSFPSISNLPAFPLDDDVSASAIPLSFWGETYDNPIPTVELPEENSSYGEGERTPTGHSPSTSKSDSSGRPAHLQTKRQRPNLHCPERIPASSNQQPPTTSPVHIVGKLETDFYPGYLRLNLSEGLVSMRKADFWLNATQILRLTGKDKKEQAALRERLTSRTQTDVKIGGPTAGSWVCYVHGRLLCEAFGLTGLLKPILEYQRADLRFQKQLSDKENYFLPIDDRYHKCCVKGNVIRIRKSDFWVNITQTFKASEQKFQLRRIKKKIDGKPYVTVRDSPQSTGTYVNFDLALEICRSFQLNDERMALEKAQETHCRESSRLSFSISRYTTAMKVPGQHASRLSSGDVMQPKRRDGDVEIVQLPAEQEIKISTSDTELSGPRQESLENRPDQHEEMESDTSNPELSETSQGPPRNLHKRLQRKEENRSDLNSLSNFISENGNEVNIERGLRSIFTEPSYSHGSFLQPLSDSFLHQL